MVGWHHRLNEHESEQSPGIGDGQGGLACDSPWCCKESDTTKQLNNNNNQNTGEHDSADTLSVDSWPPEVTQNSLVI